MYKKFKDGDFIYAYDREIDRRVAHVVRLRGKQITVAVSLVTGTEFFLENKKRK